MQGRIRDVRLDVLLVGRYPLVLTGLRTVLQAQPGIAVVGEVAGGREALAQAGGLDPHIVVLEQRQRDIHRLRLSRVFKQHCPTAKLVVYSDDAEPRAIRAQLAVGVSAYLLQTATAEELIHAVRSVGRGQRYLQTEVGVLLASVGDGATTDEPVSPRELDVLSHIARGETNEEIAGALHVAVKTVEMHVGNILSKLHVRSRVQAALYAQQLGLVAIPDLAEQAFTRVPTASARA